MTNDDVRYALIAIALIPNISRIFCPKRIITHYLNSTLLEFVSNKNDRKGLSWSEGFEFIIIIGHKFQQNFIFL